MGKVHDKGTKVTSLATYFKHVTLTCLFDTLVKSPNLLLVSLLT